MAGPIPYLDAQNLTESFGDLVLFSNISFSVAEGQRVGLIAQNGTDESTLLSVLTGKKGKDGDEIIMKKDLKIGYLEQKTLFDENESVLDACFNHQGDPQRVLKAKQMLTMLHIDDLNQPVRQLSGGRRERVTLANILTTEPELFILDRPTNHLDLEMVERLESYLSRGNKTLLMMTHDRFLLNHVCSSILELGDRDIYVYRGNYSYYLEKHQERIGNKRAKVTRVNNLYRTELEQIRRMPQTREHKARCREEAFYGLQQVAKQKVEERQIRLRSSDVYISSKIFECQYVSKAWGNKVILKDFYYNSARFEKLGIIGNNRMRKPTLIKLLTGLVEPDSGKFDIGETVHFDYFSQEGLQFNDQQKVINAVSDVAENINLSGDKSMTASQLLQHFLFTPEQQHNLVYKLSGGELRKLYLCTVLMKNPNFLVLGEPTNDLDIRTLQVLEDYLQDFPGCVIVISHDRYFMEKVVDHILVFKGEGEIQDFPGNYTQFRKWSSLKPIEQRPEERKERSAVKDYRSNEKRRLSCKEKRKFKTLNENITEPEQQTKDLEEEMCSGKLTVEDLATKSMLLPTLKEELDEKSMK